ncbi:M13 family metallopeptidase [Bacillus cereus]|uniref:M13 family metallopeptidase n=1 Tax=Bacillus cereus TaxID=1396 RepID=UPI002AC1880B|nr:M13 family metallopeptidase [Bacillus cereus]MDZ4417398.1 M13 family metallopeptidase [Bacillus cereus]
MKKIKTLGIITLGIAVVISTSACKVQDNADAKIRIQDDFYEAVNAKWLKSAKLPSSAIGDLENNVEEGLSKDLAKMETKGRSKADNEIGNMVKLYKLASDRKKLRIQGYEAIKADIEKIKSINSLADFEKGKKDLYFKSIALPLCLDVSPDMKDVTKNILYIGAPETALPDKSYYTSANSQNKILLETYQKMLANLLVMVGEPEKEAKRIAGEAVDFEKEYAQYISSSEEASILESFYHPKTINELKAYSKNIDLKKFLIDVVGKEPEQISITALKYFENLDKFINEKNWDKIKSWIYATFVLHSASKLTDYFVDTSKQLERALVGQKDMMPTKNTVYDIVNSLFGDVLGKYYAETYFGLAAKQNVTSMVNNMKGIYRNKLLKNDWLSEKTKAAAIKKLDTMKIHVGYPDKLDDVYSLFKVDENKTLFENVRFIKAIKIKNSIEKIDQPTDRDKWGIAPHVVNASYNLLTNTITLPAAVLQAPFYDKNQSASQNYGSIGSIIGHEISHAFDVNGAKHDAIGNLVNWWIAEDYKKFEEKTNAVVDQYNKVEYRGKKINGQMTVSENIADISGLEAALEATKQLPDTNLEAFFISWATMWRQKTRPEQEELLLTIDVHAPNKVRVNKVVANTNDFYSTFDIKKGDAMYMSPKDRITFW